MKIVGVRESDVFSGKFIGLIRTKQDSVKRIKYRLAYVIDQAASPA